LATTNSFKPVLGWNTARVITPVVLQVSFIRFGGVTHDFNMSQRFLPLSFVEANGSLNITAPTDANLAPPGYYMLFLVDSNGVPSVAAVTHF
jgi:hypothetical protein